MYCAWLGFAQDHVALRHGEIGWDQCTSSVYSSKDPRGPQGTCGYGTSEHSSKRILGHTLPSFACRMVHAQTSSELCWRDPCVTARSREPCFLWIWASPKIMAPGRNDVQRLHGARGSCVLRTCEVSSRISTLWAKDRWSSKQEIPKKQTATWQP